MCFVLCVYVVSFLFVDVSGVCQVCLGVCMLLYVFGCVVYACVCMCGCLSVGRCVCE